MCRILLTDPIFHDEDAARVYFESIRWPDGTSVPALRRPRNQATLVQGKSHRPGMYQCNACKSPFTVTVGSVMEFQPYPASTSGRSPSAFMASSKKGFSAHQLMR